MTFDIKNTFLSFSYFFSIFVCFSDNLCFGLYEIGFWKNCSVTKPWNYVLTSIYVKLYRISMCYYVTCYRIKGFYFYLRYFNTLWSIFEENICVTSFIKISWRRFESFSVHVTIFCSTFWMPSSSKNLSKDRTSTVFNWLVRLKMIKSNMLSPLIEHNSR